MSVHFSAVRASLMALAVAFWAAFPGFADAQQYPSKPILILTSVAPGTPFDLLEHPSLKLKRIRRGRSSSGIPVARSRR